MFHFHCSIVFYSMITCAQLYLTLCDPMDCSPPGSPVLEIFLAIRLPFPTPGDLPDPGIEPASPALAGRFFTPEPPWKPPKSTPKTNFLIKKIKERFCSHLE